MIDKLKDKTVSSVFWSTIERFSVQGIHFLLTILIARFVTPSDYGLIAMLGVFMAICQVFIDSGFSNALIQKQKRTETDYSTVFYFNIIISVLIYLLLYFCAPLIARFYHEKDLLLVTQILGLNLVINAFSVVQKAKLTIELNFKKQAIASLIAVIVSGLVGVYLAYIGYGVWAIAIQSLLNNFLNTILLWYITKWKPYLCFSMQSFKQLFGFGSKLLLSGLLHTLYVNIYNVIIGKYFSSTNLGYYNRAYTIAYFPSSNLSNIMARALYPIQCSIQNNDKQLQIVFLQHIRVTSYVVFPLMVGLGILAEPLVKLILTDKWLPIVPLLQIMCVAYAWEPIMLLNCNLLNAKGRSDFYLKSEIIKKIAAIIIILITFHFDIMIICYGLIAYAISDMLIVCKYVKKLIDCSFEKQMKIIFPILLLNVFMGLLVYISTFSINNPMVKLVTGISIGIIFYIGVSYLFKMKEFMVIYTFILNKLKL